MNHRYVLPQIRLSLILLAILVVAADPVRAQPVAASDSQFYLSVNIDALRGSDASEPLYRFLDGEVLDELRDEFGTGLVDAISGVSIFGTGADQAPAVVLHGIIPPTARDRIVDEVFRDKGEVELKTMHGRNYYEFADLELDWDGVEEREGGRHDALLIAFGDRGQSMITPDPLLMDRFLRDGALPEAEMSPELMVLQAERPLAHAGMNNHGERAGNRRHGPWESKMLRRVQRIGMVFADAGGSLAFTLEAESESAELAEAMANLVRGLISLKMLSEDPDPKMRLLDNVEVTTRESSVRLELTIPPEDLEKLLD